MTKIDPFAARKAMIDSQLRTSGVNEPFVIARMSAVAREDFVPENAKSIAYMDRAIPLGDGKALAAPLVHGKLLAEARPSLDDSALVVENGSGYLAELVKPLVAKLDTKSAEEIASGKKGRKTYTLILIDGAIEALPDALAKRLAENGRIVTGLIERGVTRIATGHSVSGNVVLQPVADIGIPLLHAFDKPKEWSF
ncbi:protein-L-isoaspartate O-methyltransferase family protein [Altererythrobacter ishigakiensis]|uniref:Protein-L-isoaspartate O-methyltransferase n=1 Tax=Altererythrobacter ishigakiensis TaxID=476157 RepID=A0A562USW6_9SPHN|nr:protein-L-isoaspartate O-methyltransferase [Altererythrobacter ishigakiensis]TWJ08705.1 protein-L-isoaspartate(D-aspartate) O-methyltransferase [Altererythrobacter ishigakiensis]